MARKRNQTTVDMLGVTFGPLEGEPGPCVSSDNSMFYLTYDKGEEFFSIYENEVRFYKGVEDAVRRHPFYSKYIKYLIDVVGIKSCQVLPNIEIPDDKKSKVTIEMHHGPMLTLFDVAQIVTTWYRKHNCDHITTCFIANAIIEEHRLNNVRTVLLAKSVHQQVHEGNIFLNYNQGFGYTDVFLEKYKEGISDSMADKINRYIEESKENDSYDNDVLKLAEKFKQWGNNDFAEFNPEGVSYSE